MSEKLKTRCKNVYTIHDKISDVYVGLTYHYTDEEMIRTFLPTVLMDYSLRDIEIVKIGIFDENKGLIQSEEHKIVSTDCYLFPHSRLSPEGEDESLETIEETCKKIKTQHVTKEEEHVTKEEENVTKEEDNINV